ncbi:MAG: translocation/assembly module TamB domain-containing protein [Spirochaetota bacterium]
MKRPIVRLTVRITAVVLLLSAIILVLGPVRGELERRFAQIRVQAVEQLEDVLGRKVSYASISPSVLRYLSVNDLTIHGSEAEPADLLTVERVRIYYRPLRLLQGRYAEAFSEIRIENTSIAVDTRRDSDLASLVSDLLGQQEAAARARARERTEGSAEDSVPRTTLADILPDDIVVSGRNIELRLRSSLGVLEMQRLFFTTTLADETVDVRWQGDARLSDTPESLPVSRVTGRVEGSGTVNAASGETLLEVVVPVLRSDVATVRGQVLQVRFSDGTLEARNVGNRDPIDIYVRYIDGTGELYARLLAGGYRLSELVTLEGEYELLNEYLALPLRGQASATLTPDALSFGGSLLTRLEGIAEVPSGDLTMRFDGDASGVEIDELRYETALGTATYRGALQLDPLRPSGELAIRNLTYGGIEPLTVTARLRSSGDTVEIATGSFRYAGSNIRGIAGNVTLDENPTADLTVEMGSDGASRLEAVTVHAADGALVRARVDARGVEPSRLVDLQRAVVPGIELPDLSLLPDAMVVDTRFELDFTDGPFLDVPLFYAYDASRRSDHLAFSLQYDDRAVRVRDLTASYEGYDGRGDFTAAIESSGAVRFTSDVVVEDIPYEFAGRLEPDNSLEISGLYDVDARLYFGERDEIVFRASGDIPLPVATADGTDEPGRLGFAADGFFFSRDDWRVDVARLTASGIPYGPVPQAAVSLSGTFSPSGARLATLGYEDPYSALEGTGSLAWDLDALAGSAEFSLSGEAEEDEPAESYEIRGSFDDGEVTAEATARLVPLLRLGVETLRGAVSGTVSAQGTLAAPTIRVDAELVDGKFNNDPVDLAALVEIGPTEVTVADGSARYVRTRAKDLTGKLSLEDGSLSLSGLLEQPSAENGDVTVSVEGSGTFSQLDGLADVVSSDFDGRLVLGGLRVRGDTPSRWTFDVARSDRATRALGGPQDAISLALDESGAFEASIDEPLPVRFDAVGFLDGGTIEADLTRVWGDGARLWAIIDSPGFALTGGTATGSVRIVGPLNDPDFYGTLVAEQVTAEVDLVTETLGPARTFIVFDEKVLSVRETVISAGEARARVGVEAVLDRWVPQEYRVSVATEEGRPVRVAGDFGGVAVDGTAAGTIVISDETGITRISGDLTAASTAITLSEEEAQEPTGDEGDLSVDLTVRTGRGVEFLWPTDAFPILRGFADVGESIRLTYESASSSYSVTGGVDIQGGQVFYFDRSFYIREGRITFEEDELEFDPLLSVNAEIREVADEGPVEIYLVAEERPLSEFTPQWRSDPPLSEAAILALLGGNVFVSESGRPIDLSGAVLLTSDVVSQFGIIQGFESTVREALQLDLFSIRTQLFQNLLRGVIDQDEEYPLDTSVPSLGQYLDNTTLFMGKYLGTDLFLELLVQLRANEPTGLETQSLAGVEVESEFGLEWQTPFFLLEWTFFPRDASTLFLTDNTISFSWDYSY